MHTLHTYNLLTKDKHPWVTVTMRKSRAPNADLLPFYIQGDRIEGVVELDLEKELEIAAIEILVCLSWCFCSHVRLGVDGVGL